MDRRYRSTGWGLVMNSKHLTSIELTLHVRDIFDRKLDNVYTGCDPSILRRRYPPAKLPQMPRRQRGLLTMPGDAGDSDDN
jgi:hypothetical protein